MKKAVLHLKNEFKKIFFFYVQLHTLKRQLMAGKIQIIFFTEGLNVFNPLLFHMLLFTDSHLACAFHHTNGVKKRANLKISHGM